MSRKRICEARFAVGLLALICIGHTAMAADPPAPRVSPPNADLDTFLFVYRTSFANSGAVQVYLGMGGLYVRTTPFRIKNYDLRPDGKHLTVYLDINMTDAEGRKLEAQLQQEAAKTPNAPPAVKAESLHLMQPSTVIVELKDPNNVKVADDYIEKGGRDGLDSISMDPDRGVRAVFNLKTAAKADEIGGYSVRVTAKYAVKMAQTKVASFQSVASAGMTVIEKAVGAKPNAELKPGDFIARDTAQQIQRASDVRRTVKLIDATSEDETRIIELLQNSLVKDVKPTDWEALGNKYVIWTPELGRLEVTPTAKTFEENEKSLKQSSKQAYEKNLESLSQEARDNEKFEDWLKVQQEKQSRKGSWAVNYDASADVFDLLSASGSGGVSNSFENDLDKANTDKGARDRIEKMYKSLKNHQEIKDRLESNFESYFKGHNMIVDYDAKAFKLAVVRDIADVSREMTEYWKVKTYGIDTLEAATGEMELKSAVAVVQDIADLRAQIDQLKKSINTAQSAANQANQDIASIKKVYTWESVGTGKGRPRIELEVDGKYLVIVPGKISFFRKGGKEGDGDIK